MKIVVVCSDFPFPADHGGRVDTWGRILALFELGWKIRLIVCGKATPSEADLEVVGGYVDEILLCPRITKLLDALSFSPLQVRSRVGLKRVRLEEDYDFVLLEGDYVYPILDNPQIRRDKVILRVHNDEAAYFKALARSARHPLHKLYYFLESFKFAALQRKMRERIDKYMFISDKEFERFRRRDPEAKSLFLPPPVAEGAFRESAFRTRNVVFIGSLFMPNNREAIEWYLTRVHPLMLKEPGYRFVVAGNSRQQGLDWLEPYDLTNVTVHDTPKSLDDIYGSGYLFVNPMRNGAGVKLKTIEAIRNGLPVVSTSVGCEGTGLVDREHLLVADRPEDFYRGIKLLFDRPQLAKAYLESSQRFIRAQYNHKEVLSTYIHSLMAGYQAKRVT